MTVFGYGTSLYLGWMMWRSRRGATLVGRFIVDLLIGITGRQDPVELMLRTERPRAMREAIHAVCREGLHVAVEGAPTPHGRNRRPTSECGRCCHRRRLAVLVGLGGTPPRTAAGEGCTAGRCRCRCRCHGTGGRRTARARTWNAQRVFRERQRGRAGA